MRTFDFLRPTSSGVLAISILVDPAKNVTNRLLTVKQYLTGEVWPRIGS